MDGPCPAENQGGYVVEEFRRYQMDGREKTIDGPDHKPYRSGYDEGKCCAVVFFGECEHIFFLTMTGKTIDAGFLVLMAFNAEAHVQFVDPGHPVHGLNIAVTLPAIDLPEGMQGVVEKDKIRYFVDLLPVNGFVVVV